MTKQLLIYGQVVPVNREAHRKLSVARTTSFDFAHDLNTLPIVDVEFARVAAEMPVVFARTEGGVVSLALLGTEQGRNAFVDGDGKWTADYVPAFLRRYPFVFATDEGADRMTLCVDEEFAGLNEDDRGERLFDGEGERTTYLNQVLSFMEEYQATFARTQAFCQRLEERDLLEEARVDYRLSDGRKGAVTGFLRVSPDKLRALPDEAVVEMFRSGDLDLIQLHLLSMNRAEGLVARSVGGSVEARAPAQDAAPKAAPAEDAVELEGAEA
jgi:hypothetical protein